MWAAAVSAVLVPLVPVYLLLGSAPAVAEEQPSAGQNLLEAGRQALLRGDGVAAEIDLRRAQDNGAKRPEIAAYLGEAYLLQGKLGLARDWLAGGRFSPESRTHGFHMLARLELWEWNIEAAREAYSKAVAQKDVTSEIWVDFGRMRYMVGEHHQAVRAALKALDVDPENPRALEFRGQLVRDAKGLKAALPWFAQGLKSAPDDLSLLGEYAATLGEMGRAKDMLRVTRRMIELDGSNSRAFYLQAVLAARAGNHLLARRLMWKTKGAYEDVPAAMLLRGILELEAGNPGLAVEELSELARMQPDNARVRLAYGRALLENGDEAELLALYRDIADRPDASPYLLTLVGRAYEATGDRLKAADYLDRAAQVMNAPVGPLAVSPQGELTLYRSRDDTLLMGAAVPALRTMLAKGQYKQALELLVGLGKRYPGSADVQVLAGDVALARGEPQIALSNYSGAADIRESFSLIERMAVALDGLGRSHSAEALVADYLRQHPQDSDAALLLGQLAAQDGHWPLARSLFIHVRNLRGGDWHNPLLHSLIARADLQAGNIDQAREEALAAYGMQRSNGHVALVLGRVLQQAGGHERESAALIAKAKAMAIEGS